MALAYRRPVQAADEPETAGGSRQRRSFWRSWTGLLTTAVTFLLVAAAYRADGWLRLSARLALAAGASLGWYFFLYLEARSTTDGRWTRDPTLRLALIFLAIVGPAIYFASALL
jgi:hypothetical protein